MGDCTDGIIARAVEVGAGNVDCPGVTAVFVDRSAPSDGVALRATHEHQMSPLSAIGAFFEAFSFSFGPIPLAAA